MTSDSREFFRRFLRELEQRNISLSDLPPQPLPSDASPPEIQFTVARADLPKLRRIQMELAKKQNWALVWTLQKPGSVLATVLVNLDNPTEFLRLNVRAEGERPEIVAQVALSAPPPGICLAVLGSDGAGKSTLLARLQILLKPCFNEELTLHFRPGVFEKAKSGVVTDPHGRPPRSVLSSWVKTVYYFFDTWAGWLSVVHPAKRRGALVIFDRNFDDMLVDPKRYRLQGITWLARFLRNWLPQADRIFVLVAPAEMLHRRKPELAVEELARQQQELRALADGGEKFVMVSAEQSPEQVAWIVWREVVLLLAAREQATP